MSHELGGFSDNWEAFNAALLEMRSGSREDGIAQAKRLLGHMRRRKDEKSRRWIRPRLVRALRKALHAGVPRAQAA